MVGKQLDRLLRPILPMVIRFLHLRAVQRNATYKFAPAKAIQGSRSKSAEHITSRLVIRVLRLIDFDLFISTIQVTLVFSFVIDVACISDLK